MIHLLYGPNDFQVRERIQQIFAEQKKLHPDLVLTRLPDEKTSLAQLQQALIGQSLLFSHRFIVGHNLLTGSGDDVRKGLARWLGGIAPELTLVLVEVELPPRKSEWTINLRQWQVEACLQLNATEIRDWLECQTTRRGVKMNMAMKQFLIANFGDDQWRLSQELDKLCLWSHEGVIDPDILEQVVVPNLPDNIFRAVDALAHKDLKAANRAINIQLAVGTSEAELLTMIAYQFRNIILVKSLRETGCPEPKIASRAGLHPYVAKKSMLFSQGFSWPQLRRIFYLLHKVDLAIKRSQTPSRIGLDILVAQVISC
ncbi:MAG: DNA polymerase III subunit delta [Patescibacteria group bacterium]